MDNSLLSSTVHMHKLSTTRIAKLRFKTHAIQETATQELLRRAQKLEIGEGILIKTKEWPHKSNPCNTVAHKALYGKRHPIFGWKFSRRTLANDRGWAIIRMK